MISRASLWSLWGRVAWPTQVAGSGRDRVYKGVLPTSKMEIAVKSVSYESGQGMREFVAEIVRIGNLRHRNVVQLLGYCRHKGELLLVYDYMPNGSLDKFLYDQEMPTLDWNQRFRVIKGVASGLLYLHEEWEKVVIHRDIKASNVLLDNEMNDRLGDFGLARLYDHGADPQTIHIVGTMGYLVSVTTLGSFKTSQRAPARDAAHIARVRCRGRQLRARKPIGFYFFFPSFLFLIFSKPINSPVSPDSKHEKTFYSLLIQRKKKIFFSLPHKSFSNFFFFGLKKI